MFNTLELFMKTPEVFSHYAAAEMWNDPHISKKMLAYHLNSEVDISSRNSTFISKSIKWIIDYFKITPQTSIADFGCGPGLYCSSLATTGAQITGIDFSENSIRYAREQAHENGQNIHYINTDYLSFETTQKFDLVIMIMCDYCALSPQQRSKLLAQFKSVLNPDGKILLDVYSLHAFENRQTTLHYQPNLLNGFWSDKPYHGFQRSIKYPESNVILDKYLIIEPSRQRTFHNWLQYFSAKSIQEEFNKHGLRIQELLKNVCGEPYDPQHDEFALVACAE